MKGISKTIVEGVIHCLILLAAFVLPLFNGKNDWEAITTFVWVLCGLVAFHLMRAIVVVWGAVAHQPKIQEVESILYAPDNTKTRQTVVQAPIAYFQIKLIGIGLLGLVILTGFSYAVYVIKRVRASVVVSTAPLQPTEIYMECHQMALPIHIPPEGTIHVKVFNKKQYGNTKWAMDDIRNDGAKERLWPDLKVIKSVKFNPGVFGYKCDVTNHAQANLIDIVIHISTNFDNEKEPLIYQAIVSPLDAGNTFSFYLINECSAFVSAIVPDAATVQVFGEEKRRTVPLHSPHRSPIEQIMMFFPSKVRWTGNVCE